VVDTIEKVSIEGMDCLMMPYVFNDSGVDFKYYENLPQEYLQKYDIVFGHFSDTSDMDISDKHVDISYLNSLGDINTLSNTKNYSRDKKKTRKKLHLQKPKQKVNSKGYIIQVVTYKKRIFVI
jgi:hypothetical protein